MRDHSVREMIANRNVGTHVNTRIHTSPRNIPDTMVHNKVEIILGVVGIISQGKLQTVETKIFGSTMY